MIFRILEYFGLRMEEVVTGIENVQGRRSEAGDMSGVWGLEGAVSPLVSVWGEAPENLKFLTI